jgi:membrane-bound metal-dependent hydrolase YbcI (DUF457 family)
MFAVGHIALGYITGKTSSKLLKVSINFPLLFTVSLIADIDLIVPGIAHRGPTHSFILFLVMAIPIALIWKSQSVPYLVAFVSHPLLGDYLTSPDDIGVQLLFPFNQKWFSGGSEALSFVYIFFELALFIVLIMMLLATNEIRIFTQPHRSNLFFIVPLSTAFLPVFTRFPIPVPRLLIIPHLIIIVLLAFSILVDLRQLVLNLPLTKDKVKHDPC